jgi:hypothetical protein
MTLPLEYTLNLDAVKLSILSVQRCILSVLERSSKGGIVCDSQVSGIYAEIVVVIIVDCRSGLMLGSRAMLVNGGKHPGNSPMTFFDTEV